MSSELKPCPFCGASPVVRCGNFYVEPLVRLRSHCINPSCPMRPTTGWFPSKESAISAWNTRSPVRVKLPVLRNASAFASPESRAEDDGYDRAIEDCAAALKAQGVEVEG